MAGAELDYACRWLFAKGAGLRIEGHEGLADVLDELRRILERERGQAV